MSINILNKEAFQSTALFKQFLSACMIKQRSIKSKRNPEDKHLYYKWGYKPLPTQTSLDKQVPEFAVRAPEFRLPSRGRLSRRLWRDRIAKLQQSRIDSNLEKLARTRQLMVSLEEVEEQWRKDYGLLETSKLAKFYGLNCDLFNDEDIVLKTLLNISFDDVEIHRGNFVDLEKLQQGPTKVDFKIEDGSFYSLILTNLDGHPLDSTKELVHLMVCNMTNNELASGETFYKYLPPLPWSGTGFHRLVFSLYCHHGRIQPDVHAADHCTLRGRTFCTPDFLSQCGRDVTPIALSWCQIEWDKSVSENYKILKDLCAEPLFGWEDYNEPKIENAILKKKLNELKFTNM